MKTLLNSGNILNSRDRILHSLGQLAKLAMSIIYCLKKIDSLEKSDRNEVKEILYPVRLNT